MLPQQCLQFLSMPQKCQISKQTSQGKVRFHKQIKLVLHSCCLQIHPLSPFSQLFQLSEAQNQTQKGVNGEADRQGQRDHSFGSTYLFNWSLSHSKFRYYTAYLCSNSTNTGSTASRSAQFSYLSLSYRTRQYRTRHIELDKKINKFHNSAPKYIKTKLLSTDPRHTSECVSDS